MSITRTHLVLRADPRRPAELIDLPRLFYEALEARSYLSVAAAGSIEIMALPVATYIQLMRGVSPSMLDHEVIRPAAETTRIRFEGILYDDVTVPVDLFDGKGGSVSMTLDFFAALYADCGDTGFWVYELDANDRGEASFGERWINFAKWDEQSGTMTNAESQENGFFGSIEKRTVQYDIDKDGTSETIVLDVDPLISSNDPSDTTVVTLEQDGHAESELVAASLVGDRLYGKFSDGWTVELVADGELPVVPTPHVFSAPSPEDPTATPSESSTSSVTIAYRHISIQSRETNELASDSLASFAESFWHEKDDALLAIGL